MTVSRWKQPAGPKGDQPDRIVELELFGTNDIIQAGSDVDWHRVNVQLDGKILSAVAAAVFDGTDGPDPIIVQIRNGSTFLLTQAITLDVGEDDTLVAALQPSIDPTTNQVHTGDLLFVDIQNEGVNAYGLILQLTFSDA